MLSFLYFPACDPHTREIEVPRERERERERGEREPFELVTSDRKLKASSEGSK